MSVAITIQETVNEVDITVNQNVITVNVTRTTGSGGGVQSVTGTTVNNTDPINPIVGVPNLTQALTQGDVSIFIQQILEDAVVTIPLEWQVSQVYIYGEPTIGTGGIFLDKTVVFSDNATLRFCWGVQYEDGVFTKTPEPYEFTTDAIVYYNGSTITSLTIQPNDLVMLKSGGIVSPGENIWILTVTNSGGVTQDLAMVLAVDNKTNEIPILSNSENGYAFILDDRTIVGNDFGGEKNIKFEEDTFTLNSTVRYLFNGKGIDIGTTSDGLGLPRLTTTQMNAIVAPTEGMIVYNTTESETYQYNGATWNALGGGAVDSVNGQTGVVVLDAGDVGAEPTKGSDDNYVTDAQLVVIVNTSGTNSGDNATNTTSNAYADAKVANDLTASTTVAPSKTAVNTALDLKQDKGNYRKLVAVDAGNTTHTGTLTETIVSSILIPSNSLDALCDLFFSYDYEKSSGNFTTIKVYKNTTNSLTGATLFASYNSGSFRNAGFFRKMLLRGTNLDTQASTAALLNNYISDILFAPSTVITLNPAVNNYILVTITLSNTGDVITTKRTVLEKLNLVP